MIRKLASFIAQYKKYAIAAPILVFLDVLSELSMPLLMARIIDIGILDKDLPYIARIGLYMVLLALAAMGFGILNMRFSSVASMGFGANLRNALFTKVQQFSFKNIDHFSTGSLITRLTNDITILQNTFIMTLRLLMRAPMMLIISFVLAMQINARLSIVIAVAIPLIVLGLVLIIRAAVTRFAIVQEKIDHLNNTLQENLIGIRVVKSFTSENFEIQKFKKSSDSLTEAGISAVYLAILNMPLMMLIMNGATIAIIWMGGQMVYFGGMGAGELISFISYIMHILMSVMMISMVILMYARAKASGERVVEVLDTNIDILNPPQYAQVTNEPVSGRLPVRHGKVEFKHVSFKYRLSGSGEDVLCDINFTVQPGQVIGIIGGTGSGKSTLVNLVPRLYDVSQGAVLVDGIDVREYPLEDLREGVSMVLQQNTLFSGTIRENLLWGDSDASQAEIETACRDAQAHEFIMEFPDGYDTMLGQGGVNLSGGQKQRVCIARAMLKKPKILILDDSTSAVDTATEAKIRASFSKNLADTTVFIIAQRISSVQEADQILVLDDGKINGIGSHPNLLESNAIYREIFASQQEGALVHG